MLHIVVEIYSSSTLILYNSLYIKQLKVQVIYLKRITAFIILFPIMKVKIYCLLFFNNFLLQITSSTTTLQVEANIRTFEVDYTNNQFLKDGQPFRYISGSMHYFRVPRIYWRDRLRKIRASGLNAVSSYVEWSTHEPVPGKFTFEGENDVEYFIKLAAEEDLLVILRVGPYICAERNLGGYPWWLLQKNPFMKLRTNDTTHTYYVERWLSELLARIQPLLYGNGGPIIMVQIENEYASYWACDKNYTSWLKNIFTYHVQTNAVLFTTDGYYVKNLSCGKIPNVLATIDFGPGTSVSRAFSNLRKVQAKGPLVNSEYYTGSLTHWGEKMKNVSTHKMIVTLKKILDTNASVNFYMFVGGTNYGFTSGANAINASRFRPAITSYHNVAPINEAGDPTDSYYAIANIVSNYLPQPPIPIPEPMPKEDYGILEMAPLVSLFKLAESGSNQTKTPLSFEEFNQGSGFILYQTNLQGYDPEILHVPQLQDRAIVFVNESFVGLIERPSDNKRLQLRAQTGQKLSILVESQGRINYGYFRDLKGILSKVIVSEIPQYNWSLFGFPPENLSNILTAYESQNSENISPPAIYHGILTLPGNLTKTLDTFIDMRGWGKGIVFVNGKNLGRYWSKGPQFTLYLPGYFLKQDNKIIVFELQKAREDMNIRFSAHPIFGDPV